MYEVLLQCFFLFELKSLPNHITFSRKKYYTLVLHYTGAAEP